MINDRTMTSFYIKYNNKNHMLIIRVLYLKKNDSVNTQTNLHKLIIHVYLNQYIYLSFFLSTYQSFQIIHSYNISTATLAFSAIIKIFKNDKISHKVSK
jgi:hypothetical protein